MPRCFIQGGMKEGDSFILVHNVTLNKDKNLLAVIERTKDGKAYVGQKRVTTTKKNQRLMEND